MSNLSVRTRTYRATEHTAYRELLAAIRSGYLTAPQITALCEILLQLHVASRLLDESTAPGAFHSCGSELYDSASPRAPYWRSAARSARSP